MCPRGGSRLAGTVGALSSEAPFGAEGARIRGETSNELRKAGTKAERDDLTSQRQRNKAPPSPQGGRSSSVPVFVTTAEQFTWVTCQHFHTH